MKEIVLALIKDMSASFAFTMLVFGVTVTVPPMVYFAARRRYVRDMRKLEIAHQETMFQLQREHPKQIGQSKVIDE